MSNNATVFYSIGCIVVLPIVLDHNLPRTFLATNWYPPPTNSGTIITSSINPIKGIISGIKSIKDTRYITPVIIKTFGKNLISFDLIKFSKNGKKYLIYSKVFIGIGLLYIFYQKKKTPKGNSFLD
jgi:hypothetical protein